MLLKSTLVSLLLFVTLTSLALSTPSKSTTESTNPSIAHCECRCCHRISRMQEQCDDHPKTVPLSPPTSCDSPMTYAHDQSVCGIPLCQAHFPDLCPSPSFITHACVSDRGAFRDWLPLVFGCVTLLALAIVFRTRAAAVPTVDADHFAQVQESFKREPIPSPSALVTQPLISAQPHRSYDGIERTFEILDVSPRSPLLAARAGSVLPPMRELGHPSRSGSMSQLEAILPLRGKAFNPSDAAMRRSTGDIWSTVTNREVT